MHGRRKRGLPFVLTTTGGENSDGWGEIFSLEDFVTDGRVAVSGKFTGTLQIWGSNDAFRGDELTAVQVGSDFVGLGLATWYYAEAAVNPDVMYLRVKCTVNIVEASGPEIPLEKARVSVSGGLR